MEKKGKVYFIGAAFGNSKFILARGLELIQKADVIIYDKGIDEDLLELVSPDADVIAVGEKASPANGSVTQEDMRKLILEKAKEGKTIIRLKNEDLFAGSKGNEDIEAISSSGIYFEIIPGLPAFLASIYAGIPLIHRKITSNFIFISTQEENTKRDWLSDLEKIPAGFATLVFYPGINNFPRLVEKLTESGYRKDFPVAVIKDGGTSNQNVITGELGNITGKVEEKDVKSPSVVIIGEVVELREKNRWFDNRLLFGKKIVITRSQTQAKEFGQLLEEQGAEVIEFPTIETVPVTNSQDFDNAINEISKYNWIIFTSSNGVKYFFELLKKKGEDLRCLKGIKICTIGPGTAKAVENLNLRIDFIPKEYRAEGIIEGFIKEDIKGKNILIPRAEVAREILPDKLEEMGANVNVLSVYRTIKVDSGTEKIKRLLTGKEIDVITFTSASTAENFISLFHPYELKELMRGVNIASIGPITSSRIENAGLKVKITPSEYTIEKLAEAIGEYYEKRKS